MGGSSSKPKDMTPREFRGLRDPLADTLRGFISSGGLPAYGGPLNAPITGGETDALTQLQQLTQGSSPEFTAALQTLLRQSQGQQNPGATAAGLTAPEAFGLTQIGQQGFGTSAVGTDSNALLQSIIQGRGLSPESNPFLASYIQAAQRPIIEQFGDASRGLRGTFNSAGQFTAPGASSPFELAAARLNTGVANALGDVGSNIAFQNYDAERNRQLAAVGLGQTQDANAFQRAIEATAALGLPRQIEDTAIQRQGAAFEADQSRQTAAAQAIPQLERQQIENVLTNLQAQALPRLIEELGIERGMAAFQQQQQSLLAILQLTGQVSSPTVAQRSSGGNPILGAFGDALGSQLGGSTGLGGFLAGGLFG